MFNLKKYIVTIAFKIRPWFHKCGGVNQVNEIATPVDN